MKKYDAIVVGKGPAGISAAIYLRRGNLNVLVIGKDSGVVSTIGEIENYYPLGRTTGEEIQKQGEEHAQSLGIEIIEDEVLRIEMTLDGFSVKTVNDEFETGFVFLGIGSKRKRLDIENIRNFEGKGVSYCAVCDGFFYRDKDVAVYGNSNYAIEEAEMLANTVNKVFILTDGKTAIPEILELHEKDSDKFQIKEGKIAKMFGGDRLETVEFTNGSQVNTQGFFIAEEANNKSFAMQLGILMEGELIVIDKDGKTNVEGIYAGGDTTPGPKQIVRATHEGMVAALSIIKAFNLKRFAKKNSSENKE